MDSSAVSARLIGLMFVEKGLITEEQLERALELQRATGDRLGEIIVAEFGVERLDLADALAEQWAEYETEGTIEERAQLAEKRDLVAVSDEWRGDAEPAPAPSGKRPIGEIFVERGLISAIQLEDALEEQKKSGRRLGEILVATGRLSRLELASALADQWASFQKLRPPGEEAPTEARMIAMPVAAGHASSPTAPAPAPSPELLRRMDELAARVEALAKDGGTSAAAATVPDELVARIEQLESGATAHEPESVDDVRSELAEVRAQLAELIGRIDSIPAPNVEWHSELAEVAGNLRTRVERVEQGLDGGPSAGDVAELRTSVDALAVRVDLLPPFDEWREPLAELTRRLESLPTDEWRPELERIADKLRSRLERVEQGLDGASSSPEVADLRGSFEALVARVEALPVPSEEWRDRISELAARVDALPLGDWKPELAEVAENLRTRLERVEQGIESSHGPAVDAELRGEVESRFAELAARLDAVPTAEWRPELAEVAENLRTRLERIEQSVDGASGSAETAELRAWLESLSARLDALPAPSEEWREQVAQLELRLEAIPADDWRPQLEKVAESLRSRLERLEQNAEGGQSSTEVTELRAALDALAARVDSLPLPSEEWRDQVSELRGRVDALPLGDWRPELAEVAEHLRTRLERLEQNADPGRSAAEVAELRASLEALAARVASLPAAPEDWREPLSQLAEGVHVRLERLEHGVESAHASADVAELRRSLEALAGRIDALPAPAESWRGPLSQLADALGERLDRIEQHVDGGRGASEVAELRASLEALAARADALPPSDEWREPFRELARRIDELPTPSHDWRDDFAALAARLDAIPPAGASTEALDALRAHVDDLATRAAEGDGVEARLREALTALVDERAAADAARADDLHRRVDGVATGIERSTGWTEELAHRVDELAARRDATEIEQALGERFAAVEERIAALHNGLAAVQPSVEQRIAEAEERAVAAAGHASTEIGSLRQELDEVRTGVESARTAAVERVDAATAALRDQLESAAHHAADNAVGDLRPVVEAAGARIDDLAGALAAAEERGTGRAADLSALRARLETVESALSGALGWHDAVESAQERVESLELRVSESLAAEAVERDDQISRVLGDVSERIDAIGRERVKKKDVRQVREAIDRVEQRVDERFAEEDAAVRATEAAVRESLSTIGEQLSASGESYLETGRELSRSIAGLGLALAASDALRAAAPRTTDAVAKTVFLAFAPTVEGYRLVECEGMAPAVGAELSVEECEGPLVVTRIGPSPLPFDRRPCVYLEPAG